MNINRFYYTKGQHEQFHNMSINKILKSIIILYFKHQNGKTASTYVDEKKSVICL